MDQILADLVSFLRASPITTTNTDVSLDDDHLPKANYDGNLVTNIGRALAAHAGPLATVRITNVQLEASVRQLDAWFQILAAKNVRNLVIVNRPPPDDIVLPADLLRCEQLESLCIGFSTFPNTTDLSPAFAGLRDLGIFHSIVEGRDLDAVLDRCKELQRLSLVRSPKRTVVGIRSSSLQIVAVWNSKLEALSIDDAPRLERLILEVVDDDYTWFVNADMPRPAPMHIKILQAPELQVLGYLHLCFQTLTINGAKIDPFVKDESTIPRVGSVKTLALKMSLRTESQVCSLRSLLICFTNLETLHIMRVDDEEGLDYGAAFWEELLDDSISCLQLHLSTVVFEGFWGGFSEVPFAKSILEHARVLTFLWVVFRRNSSELVVDAAQNALLSADRASAHARVLVYKRSAPSSWSFHKASEQSLMDPFDG